MPINQLTSINIQKTKFTSFHINHFNNEIPLNFPALKIGNDNIEKKHSTKFLEVILNKHVPGSDHVRNFENKRMKRNG